MTLMPLFVEFIGPSGVGKSTLLRQLLRSDRDRSFFSLEKAFLVSRLKLLPSRLPNSFFYNRTLRKIGDIATHREFERVIRNKSLWESASTPAYIYFLNYALETTFSSERDIALKLDIAIFLKKLISQYISIESRFNSDKPILVDEGLLMNIRGIENISLEKMSDFNIVLPRIVINCTSNPEVVMERYMKRAAEAGKKISVQEAKTAFEVTQERSIRILTKVQMQSISTIEFDLTNVTHTKIKNLQEKILKKSETFR